MQSSPQLLAIGHVTFDVTPDDLETRHPGGAVAFASVTASRLGIQPAIITSCADDYPAQEVIDDPDRFIRIPSAHTSTFENRYNKRGDRLQILHHRADDITRDSIPEAWLNLEMLFVGPLTQEFPPDCLDWFNPRVSCVVPQGWLRSWTQPLPSTVSVSKSPPLNMSAGWDICVISESETEPNTIQDWRTITRNLVVTKGPEGADLYQPNNTNPTPIPSFANKIPFAGTDTTGAGDVFAAAMLIRYTATSDPVQAANYASACAALSTRAPSWNAVQKGDASSLARRRGFTPHPSPFCKAKGGREYSEAKLAGGSPTNGSSI